MSLEERVQYAKMKARHKNELRPWYAKWWGVILIIITSIILIFIIAAGIYVVKEIQAINNGTVEQNTETQVKNYLAAINGGTDNFWGPSDAPVTIVEFSDFACPFCKQSHPGLKNIREKYGDKVRIVYRDYTLR